MYKFKSILTSTLLVFAVTSVGCGDSSGNKATSTGTASTPTQAGTQNPGTNTGTKPGDSTGTGTKPGTPPPPVFAVLTQIFAPNARTTYILTTGSMAAQAAPMEVAGGIEVAGRAIGVAVPQLGALLVGSNESPVLRRYNLTPQGTLNPTPTELSLAPYGIAGISEYQGQFQVVSPTKAYFFDGKTAQIAVFDPTAMTLTKKIDLASLTRAGHILTFSPRAVRSKGKIIMPVGWRTTNNKQIPSETGVVTLDTNTDTATVATDKRCGYARDATVGDDGKIYLVTDAYAAAVHRLSATAAPKPCVLRFDPMTAAYDANFYVDATTLTGGAVMGSSVPGPGNSALVSVLNEGLAADKIKPETFPRALSAMPVWNWWQLKLGDTPSATAVAGAPLSNGSHLPLEVGTQIFLSNFSVGKNKISTLTELTETGLSTAPGLQVKGLVFSAMKLR